MVTMDSPSDATKILEKGPDYLRKQMELETETRGHMSAVERLAASKQKYVKSQLVANSTQEPVITIGSGSVSSTGSSHRKSSRSIKLITRSITKITPDAAQTSSPGQVRRSSSKKRPDSLLLYRQKCDLLRGSVNDHKSHPSHKLLLHSTGINTSFPEADELKYEGEGIKEKISTPEGTAQECRSHVATSQFERTSDGVTDEHSTKTSKTKSGNHLTVPDIVKRPGKGVSRSHSDISSRYSKNFADFDGFFRYCGLESDVIQSLGKENFMASSDELALKIRNISISLSDDGFSRNIDSDSDEGLLEHQLHKKKNQGTSVIERNARIIKWLYSCKNAKETGKRLRDLD